MELDSVTKSSNSLITSMKNDEKIEDLKESVISNYAEDKLQVPKPFHSRTEPNLDINTFKVTMLDDISQEVALITGKLIGPCSSPNYTEQCIPRDVCLPEMANNSIPNLESFQKSELRTSYEEKCEDTESSDAELSDSKNVSETSMHFQSEAVLSPSTNERMEDVTEGSSPKLDDSSTRLLSPDDATHQFFSDRRKFSFSEGTRRSKRSKEWKDACPICGVTLRISEIRGHFDMEVEKLKKIQRGSKRPRIEKDVVKQSFHQVKSNRENRITARVARFSERARNEIKCPVCQLRISGCQEDINKHVGFCYQNEDLYDEDVVVDDDEEEFEEYEIGDETRIRPISLVPGGHRALDGQHVRPHHNEDEDVDIVDVDTIPYGEPQYTEFDIITNRNSYDENSEQLRKAVLMNVTAQPLVLESRKWSTSADECVENKSKNTTSDISSGGGESGVSNFKMDKKVNSSFANQVVSSLKARIKDLEDENRSVKCLICMEPYTKPVVSTTCWHVHCEECWLMTMGVKKLCPQCNMIVFPSDLRKIFL